MKKKIYDKNVFAFGNSAFMVVLRESPDQAPNLNGTLPNGWTLVLGISPGNMDLLEVPYGSYGMDVLKAFCKSKHGPMTQFILHPKMLDVNQLQPQAVGVKATGQRPKK